MVISLVPLQAEPFFSLLVLRVSSKHIEEEIKVKADKQEHNDTKRD